MAIGDIFYSFKAKNFYQEGRSGRVSRDVGARSLTYDPATERFIDSRGNTVPREILQYETRTAQRFTRLDLESNSFVSTETRTRLIAERDAQTARLKPNQQITIRTVVTTPDGKVHVSYWSGGLGQNVNPGEARKLASQKARGDLLKTKDPKGKPYSITTNEVKQSTQTQDFYRKEIGVKRGVGL